MSRERSEHPAWGLARVMVVCLTLLGLQMMTATQYDVSIDGEAGTLAGVTLMSMVMEWLRKAQ